MAVYLAGINQSVDTGNSYFEEIRKLPIAGAVEAKHKLKRSILNRFQLYDGQPLEARIEYARWIVDCPNCHNAEFAFEDNLFFCSQCLNSDIDGKARKVKMPEERKQIEAILGKRAIINRHWYPNETVEDLENENLKKGVI